MGSKTFRASIKFNFAAFITYALRSGAGKLRPAGQIRPAKVNWLARQSIPS